MTAGAPPARVLVADAQPLLRSGLRAALAPHPDLAWVGEAADAAQALEQAARCAAHVVVLDPWLPGGEGSATTARLHAHAVLVLGDRDDQASVLGSLRAGARGYVTKVATGHDVVHAIRAVAAGDTYLAAPVAHHLLDAFSRRPTAAARAFPTLTDRERDVLEQLALGNSNGQIARDLGLSPKTVRNHVANITTKLRVLDRAQVILRARAAGLADQSNSS